VNADRDDRDGGGSGGLAVLVVAGILVVMLLMLGAGAIYCVRQVMVLREETAARVYAEKLAWKESMQRKKAEDLAAIIEAATMREEAAIAGDAKAAKGAPELGRAERRLSKRKVGRVRRAPARKRERTEGPGRGARDRGRGRPTAAARWLGLLAGRSSRGINARPRRAGNR